ncbi:hypothetical protein [Dechloromonas denitrificans]|uniref:hypothetical protein n=1 Tax=Dechloromonas denitrificans TaxID=281362 RepID=UPI001CF97C7C|nr:hypothetical protein [Dechloromonas denitrificans]UCV07087.1 hypothetical protein KI615_17025 [Dechloromonas denitrificans]
MSEFVDTTGRLIEALTKVPVDAQSFFAELEGKDELEVREALVSGRYNSRRAPLAQEWLRRKEDARVAEAMARAEAREAESLSIANMALAAATEANRIASEDLAAARESAASAREQARWAMWAAIIATVAAIVAMFKV